MNAKKVMYSWSSMCNEIQKAEENVQWEENQKAINSNNEILLIACDSSAMLCLKKAVWKYIWKYEEKQEERNIRRRTNVAESWNRESSWKETNVMKADK